MNKEKWIEGILQSAKGIKPVASNQYMVTRIEARLQGEPVPPTRLSLQWVFASAIVILALAVINIRTWQSPAGTKQNPGIQQVIQEYGWNNTNDLYSVNFSNR